MFSINVTQVGNGFATLSWTAPTTNTDGSPLLDLGGYRVYWGLNANALNNVVDIPVGVLTHRVGGLNSGLYYFAVSARTTANIESDLSEVLFKLVL
jgi:hypothetical protein